MYLCALRSRNACRLHRDAHRERGGGGRSGGRSRSIWARALALHRNHAAMSAANPPAAAAAEAATEGGGAERRTIPRIFVSERTRSAFLRLRPCATWRELVIVTEVVAIALPACR